MNKAQAIRDKCFGCSGESHKEVTLCHVVHCPLWPHRFGYSYWDKRFLKRIESAKRKYPRDYAEMAESFRGYLEIWPNPPAIVQIDTLLGEDSE
jgi:hypothetical protein